jgi:predicted ATPase
MGVLAVEQVAQRLDVSLDVLSGANRMSASRQQTLRVTIDWSHKLLSEAERTFFRRLSVFAGVGLWRLRRRCALEAALRKTMSWISSGGWLTSRWWWPGRPRAARCATGCSNPSGSTPARSLRRVGKADEVQNRHAAFFLAVAEEAEPDLAGPQQSVWLERLEREHDNLREALSWALQRGEAELAL